jgi:hypothetical protein
VTTIQQVSLIVAIGAILAAPVLVRIVRHEFDPFEPIVLFALAYGVMFVVRPTYMIARSHLAYDGPLNSTDVSSTFSKMLVLALAGAGAFVVGYQLRLGPRLAARRRGHVDLTERRVVLVAGITGALGIVSLLVFAASTSGFSLIFRGDSNELANQVADKSFYLWYSFFLLVPATLVLLAVGLERRRKALLVAASALGAVFLLRTVPLGARFALLPLLGGAFVLHYVRRTTRPSPIGLVAVALVALVGSSFLSDLRGRATRSETVAQTVVRSTRPARIAAPFLSGPDSEMAPVLAAALKVIPKKLPYTYGRTIFGDLVSRPIPRTLWSDKPLPPRNKLIDSLWPVQRQKAGINPEFSVLLYFYWDFAIFGVLGGMLLYGIGARTLFEYFLNHRHELQAQVVYSLSLWFVVIGLRNGPVDTFVPMVFMVFPAWLAFRLSASQNAPVVVTVPR